MTVVLPAISVRPPWALAITRFSKDTENRWWKFAKRACVRGPLLIHASKTLTELEYYEALASMPSGVDVNAFPAFKEAQRGGIVGACELYAVGAPLEVDRGWAQAGALRLLLRNQVELPFRTYPGALGFFKVALTHSEAAILRTAGLLPSPPVTLRSSTG